MKPEFIDHLVIGVKNLIETKDFYNNFLGLPEYEDAEQIVYSVGNTKIFFSTCHDWENKDKDKGGLNHLAFGVKTIDELKNFKDILEQVNIKNSGIQIDKYGKKEFIWFDDPNNTRLEFYLR